MKTNFIIHTFLFLIICHGIISECKKGCLKCDTVKSVCQFCDITKNYLLDNGKCVLLNYENCLKYDLTGSCILCNTGFYVDKRACSQILEENLIEKCLYYSSSYQCMTCEDGYYYYNDVCQEVPTKLQGCSKYKSSSTISCSECSSGYMLSRDQTSCIIIEAIDNCSTYSYIECKECAEEYILNKNYYFESIRNAGVNTTYDSQIYTYLYKQIQTPINFCEKNQIKHCIQQTSAYECTECEEGYYINGGDCFINPEPAIQNCSKYSSLNVCAQCNKGFYLYTKSSCLQIEEISNCLEYSTTSQTSECILCEQGYKVANGKCAIRVDTIQNCDKYVANSDLCQACNEGYQTTSDQMKCLTMIDNCKTYDNSSKTSIKLTCKYCIDGMTYISANMLCEQGIVDNCKIYTAEGQCTICDNGYYLSQNKCLENVKIENCNQYDQSTKGVCQECDSNYLLFTLINTCELALSIPNCVSYEGINECGECEIGYQLINQQKDTFKNYCEVIDISLHCYKYLNNVCTYCKEGYVLNSGVCTKEIDYLQSYCISDNNTGKISRNNYKCNQCKKNTIPAYLVDTYICTNQSNLNSDLLTENCIKYDYNTDSQIYQCVLCKDGYYQQDSLCVQQCDDGSIIYVQDIQKILTSGSTGGYYNKYSIAPKNICRKPLIEFSGCSKLAVNSFIQNISYDVIDYVCVECKQGFFPTVSILQTTNLPANNLTSEYKGQLFTYPGLTCTNSSTKTIQASQLNAKGLVENCEYYSDIKFEEGESVYGCIKCSLGYYGIVTVNMDISQNGYIQSCQSINLSVKPSHGLNKNCDLSVVYSGYTTYSSEIQINLLPLESFLSCYKCVSTQKPFLYLSFEDFELLLTGTQYSKSLQSGQSLNYPPQLSNYKVIYKDIDYGIIGESIRCMDVNIASLYSRSTKSFANIIKTYSGNIDNCALFIVNTMRYTISQSSIYDSDFQVNSVYCGACMPGYKANLYSELKFDADFDQFNEYIPYIVSNCLKISHCADGDDFVNNCKFCEEGYKYEWDSTNKYVQYNKCIQCNINNCLACSENSCQVCVQGYTLFPQYSGINANYYCEQIIAPFCEDKYSVYQRVYDASKDNVSMGRNYLSLREMDTGCNKCSTGYIALKLVATNNINLDMVCSFSGTVKSNLITNITYLVDNCSNYSIDTNNHKYIKCSLCNTGYLLTDQNKCVQNSSIKNCAKIQIFNNENQCIECQSGYIFLDGDCVLGSLENCLSYDNNSDSKSEICENCDSGYVVLNNICVAGDVDNCDTYESSNDVCQFCQTDYQLLILKDDVNMCLEIPQYLNCIELSPEEFKDQNVNCVTCAYNYYASTSTGDVTSFCFKFTQVQYCLLYDKNTKVTDSTLNCIECQNEYFLESGKKCSLRENYSEQCESYNKTSDSCFTCKQGYYNDNDGIGCKQNPTGILGCINYKNKLECTKCDENMYLNEDGLCYNIEVLINNCKYYTEKKECQQCINGYYYSDSCKQTSVSNCEIATGNNVCQKCLTGYALDKTGQINTCIKLEDEQCLIFSTESPFLCITCNSLFYPKSGKCTLRSQTDISQCLYYTSETECQQCQQSYLLSLDKKECTAKPFQIEFIDDNCLNSITVNPFYCAACSQGYYFVDKICTQCQTQTYSKGCAYCDPNNQEECLMCRSGYFMDVAGKCNSNITEEQNGGNGEVVNSSTMLQDIALVILLLIMQFIFFQIIKNINMLLLNEYYIPNYLLQN